MHTTRVLDLPGSCNLRDFGGYATRDGRYVRRGRLFRSGTMTRLAPSSVAALRGYGLRAICDLRRTDERQRQPNPDFGADVRAFEWDTQAESSPLRASGVRNSASDDEARALMVEMYRGIPFLLRRRLAGAFAALAHAGDGATIVHCSAGKDRTGVAVGLVLEALGVPRETVVAEYALTSQVVDLGEQLMRTEAGGFGMSATAETMLALPPNVRAIVLEAHPSYLDAAFIAVEAKYGTVEGYLHEELGLSQETLAGLRRRLVE